MTAERKKEREKGRRTVTPDIGTDTKSLIWPAVFFPQVDEKPLSSEQVCHPFCAHFWSVQKRKAKLRDPPPRYVAPSSRSTPKRKTLRTVISGTNIFLIDTQARKKRERENESRGTRLSHEVETNRLAKRVVVQTNTPVRDLRTARQFRALTVRMGCARRYDRRSRDTRMIRRDSQYRHKRSRRVRK